MKKVLFNITRRVGDDEISSLWLDEGGDWSNSSWAEQKEDGRVVKFMHREVGDCCALVVHSSLWNEMKNESALDDKIADTDGEANASVQDVITDVMSEESLTAVLYHDTDSEDALWKGMARHAIPDADLHFVTNYSSSSKEYDLFYKPLAGSDEEHFEEKFDALWDHFAPDEELEFKLNLLHECLTPEGAQTFLDEENVPSKYKEQVAVLTEYSEDECTGQEYIQDLETLRKQVLDAP